MNDRELKLYCLEHAGEKIPAEAEALLQGDPDLKRQVERLVAVKNLMSLKRYEQPSAASLDRCLRGVREQIARQPEGIWDRVRSYFEFEQPALAYAVAALALAVVGAAVYINQGAGQGPTIAQEIPELPQSIEPVPMIVAVETPAPVADDVTEQLMAEPFPAFDKPLIVLRTENTNYQPSTPRMSIGGGQVVPVSFEY